MSSTPSTKQSNDSPETAAGGDGSALELSVVIPVYANEDSLVALVSALATEVMPAAPAASEVVLVVDGSPDRSWERLQELLARQPWRSQLLRHSRNFGSFAAIRTGMTVARGDVVVVMAADLQEPPRLAIDLWLRLHDGEADVAFGVRQQRDDGWVTGMTSRLFWGLFRRLVVPAIPAGGVDVFAVTRPVRDAVLAIAEPNSSLVAQLFWVGFRRAFVPYVRRKRQSGRSGWTWRRRLAYMIDSFVSFTDLPIMFQIWLGVAGLLVSSVASAVVLGGRLLGWITVAGYTPIMLLVAFVGSSLLLSQGILGLYLWRAFENTKRRPLAIVAEKLELGGYAREPST